MQLFDLIPETEIIDISFEIEDSLMIIKRNCKSQSFKAVINLSDKNHILI